MARGALRLKGLRELQGALRKVNREVARDVRSAFLEVARPVARAAQGKLARYSGASVGTIGPRATGRSVFVTQRARKVTGRRGDFGSLQMREVLEPALEEHEREVLEAAEDVVDKLGRSAGFN